MVTLSAGLRFVGLVAMAFASIACGDDSSTSTSSGTEGSGGSAATSTSNGTGGADDASSTGAETTATTGGAESCEATFRVLQKDAYKESAGRSSPLWPPHTTTVLEVACDGEAVDDAFQANHGTEPGQMDAAGDVVLVEMATFTATGSRSDLVALLDAYRGCDCEDTTAFLSVDSLESDLTEGLLETVLGYIQTNLTCPGDTLSDLLTALQEGDFETAVVVFPTCSWVDGASFEDGLSEAFAEVIAETSELLTDYHVCNNDAAVQKGLFDGFVADGTLACPGGDLCRGPLWFYDVE